MSNVTDKPVIIVESTSEAWNDLVLSTMELLRTRKSCTNCYHYRQNYCSYYSCECATAVFNKKESPPRWTSYSDGEAQESLVTGTHSW